MAQADDFAAAIDAALSEVAKHHKRPELNAMLGALAGRTGSGLAMIEDDAMRRAMFKKVCAEIERSMSAPAKRKAVLVERPD